MTAKKMPAKSTSTGTPEQHTSLYHRLDALLHSMRCIGQYEDALCEVSHEIKRSGILTPETSDELRGILDRIPSQDYVHDLDAVNELLAQTATQRTPLSATTRKPMSRRSSKKAAKDSSKASIGAGR